MDSLWLILLLAVPLAGAILGAFVPTSLARGWALLVSLLTFVVSLMLASQVFAGHPPIFHSPNEAAHLPALGTSFALGVNSLSIWLVLLTTFLQPLAIASSFGSITTRQREYYAWINALLVAMLGVFIARDLLLFYVFFELTLVPMFFLIGIWGGPDRRYAARKFFIYTLAGSLLTFLGLIAVVIVCYHKTSPHALTFSIPELVSLFNDLVRNADGVASERAFYESFQFWVFLAMMAGFAIKVPLFPVHTWLPLAHV